MRKVLRKFAGGKPRALPAASATPTQQGAAIFSRALPPGLARPRAGMAPDSASDIPSREESRCLVQAEERLRSKGGCERRSPSCGD